MDGQNRDGQDLQDDGVKRALESLFYKPDDEVMQALLKATAINHEEADEEASAALLRLRDVLRKVGQELLDVVKVGDAFAKTESDSAKNCLQPLFDLAYDYNALL